jgi:hypothetical protein
MCEGRYCGSLLSNSCLLRSWALMHFQACLCTMEQCPWNHMLIRFSRDKSTQLIPFDLQLSSSCAWMMLRGDQHGRNQGGRRQCWEFIQRAVRTLVLEKEVKKAQSSYWKQLKKLEKFVKTSACMFHLLFGRLTDSKGMLLRRGYIHCVIYRYYSINGLQQLSAHKVCNS